MILLSSAQVWTVVILAWWLSSYKPTVQLKRGQLTQFVKKSCTFSCTKIDLFKPSAIRPRNQNSEIVFNFATLQNPQNFGRSQIGFWLANKTWILQRISLQDSFKAKGQKAKPSNKFVRITINSWICQGKSQAPST